MNSSTNLLEGMLENAFIEGYTTEPFNCCNCGKESLKFVYLNSGKLVVFVSSFVDLTKLCSEKCLKEQLYSFSDKKVLSDLADLTFCSSK